MEKDVIEAINRVMAEVGYVQKEGRMRDYSYARERDLIAALRPAMVKHGVVMYVSKILSTHTEMYTTKSGTPMNRVIITGEVTFAIPGSSITVQAVGEGADAGDKASYKAATGLYKYALRQTFCIETGDDPDASQDEEREEQPKQRPQKPRKTTGLDPKNPVHVLVLQKVAENVHNAAGIVNMMPQDVLKAGAEEVLRLGRLYRGYRDMGAEPDAAMKKAIEKYNPHE